MDGDGAGRTTNPTRTGEITPEAASALRARSSLQVNDYKASSSGQLRPLLHAQAQRANDP